MNMSVNSAGKSGAGLFQAHNRIPNKLQNKNSKSLQENLSKFAAQANEAATKREVQAKNKADRVKVTSYIDKEGRVHKTFSGSGTNVVETMQKYASEKKKDDVKVKKRLQYSYQKVSNQVLMAKNSMSASKAVISAKRGLADLKRKLKTAECSDDEKQAALTHAMRMVNVAKKKKKHLDLEELVENTMKMDERLEKMEECDDSSLEDKMITDSENQQELAEENMNANQQEMSGTDFEETFDEALLDEMNYDATSFADEMVDLSEALNVNMGDVVESVSSVVAEEMSDVLSDSMEESIEELSEEFADELSEEMAEMLSEEMQDLMDMMEIVNPHMDEEHFEKLKLKHRTEENKALVKADTDYLKAYIKSIQSQGTSNNSAGKINGGVESISGMNPTSMGSVDTVISPDVSSTSIGFSVTV